MGSSIASPYGCERLRSISLWFLALCGRADTSLIPGLPAAISPIFGAALASSVAGAAGTFALASAIGFPLPFTLVCESAIGMPLIGMGMLAAWGRFLASDRNGRRALFYLFGLMMMQASMVWVYPAYAYVFNQLSDGRQIAAMALLPLMKMFYKSSFARMLREHPDLKPCAIVFSADLYRVLFLSWCMNGSTSKKAIMSLMLVDLLEAVMVLHEVNKAVTDITSTFSKEAGTISLLSKAKAVVRNLRSSSSFTTEAQTTSLMDRAKAAMGVQTSYLAPLSRDKHPGDPKIVAWVTQPKSISVRHTTVFMAGNCGRRVKESCVVPSNGLSEVEQMNHSPRLEMIQSVTAAETRRVTSSSTLVDLAVAARHSSLTSDPKVDTAILHEFLHRSLGLLYTTEFVLLIEFTEVIIPCLYSKWITRLHSTSICANICTNIHVDQVCTCWLPFTCPIAST
ncbi:unnamed protein product [Phytophthora fragariaefolia]|uniref:Unnamed protein product n=1 Tax=Phytophthora fragariaefolia TaxID=1490495 RepID=A0A9W6YH42_9STRA|nr:unnamed protein product [Phytophthora fragariaefolia]